VRTSQQHLFNVAANLRLLENIEEFKLDDSIDTNLTLQHWKPNVTTDLVFIQLIPYHRPCVWAGSWNTGFALLKELCHVSSKGETLHAGTPAKSPIYNTRLLCRQRIQKLDPPKLVLTQAWCGMPSKLSEATKETGLIIRPRPEGSELSEFSSVCNHDHSLTNQWNDKKLFLSKSQIVTPLTWSSLRAWNWKTWRLVEKQSNKTFEVSCWNQPIASRQLPI
jgi:hypothetical protein